MNMKIQKVALLILVIIIVSFVGWKLLSTGSEDRQEESSGPSKIVDDPIDATVELYNPWLAALQSTSTGPNKSEIINNAPLTADLRARLINLINESETIDPILCQLELPERIGVKSIYKDETGAQVVVVARGTRVPQQALVTLELINNGWLLTNIECSDGEIAPEREFSFVNEGFLLRTSLQPPLDSSKWHLIYSKDDVPGHAIPLLFDESSMCILADGGESVCSTESLTEASKASLKGAMQEAGVLIKRLEIYSE
jgi:hypothetical protein